MYPKPRYSDLLIKFYIRSQKPKSLDFETVPKRLIIIAHVMDFQSINAFTPFKPLLRSIPLFCHSAALLRSVISSQARKRSIEGSLYAIV